MPDGLPGCLCTEAYVSGQCKFQYSAPYNTDTIFKLQTITVIFYDAAPDNIKHRQSLQITNRYVTLYLHMNWKVITGLVLLVVGVRVMSVALEATGSKAWMAGIGGAIWIIAGTFLIVKNIVGKENKL